MQNFFANEMLKFFAEKMFNIVVIKNNFINIVNFLINKVLFIIKFLINLNFKIDIDYDFRN